MPAAWERKANFHFDVFARMGYEDVALKVQDLYLEEETRGSRRNPIEDGGRRCPCRSSRKDQGRALPMGGDGPDNTSAVWPHVDVADLRRHPRSANSLTSLRHLRSRR